MTGRPRPAALTLLLALTAFFGFCVAGCTTIRPQSAPAAPLEGPLTHERFDRVLQRFVDSDGRVDYSALHREDTDLQAYYAQVAAYSPDSHPALFPTASHRLAYWINAYNAAVLVNVLRHYPIAGVTEIKAPFPFFFMPDRSGFFYFHRLLFGGRALTLYTLEHKLIRPRFADPRLHFALNCASTGCPRLPRNAFSANDLDEELERETRHFLSEERNFRIDAPGRAVYLSALFDWYAEDFLAALPPGATVLDYVGPYLADEPQAQLRRANGYALRYIPYDWSLNSQR